MNSAVDQPNTNANAESSQNKRTPGVLDQLFLARRVKSKDRIEKNVFGEEG